MESAVAEQLIRARQGDVEAFAYVAAAYRGQLLAWARTLTTSSHEAEDAVQDALLAAFTGLGELREIAAFPAWLRSLLRSAAVRQRRRRRPDLLESPEVAVEEADSLISSELHWAVRSAVTELAAGQQAVIEAHYTGGEPLSQIAARLNLPLGTVKRRLHEAREKLRVKLAGFGRSGADTWRSS